MDRQLSEDAQGLSPTTAALESRELLLIMLGSNGYDDIDVIGIQLAEPEGGKEKNRVYLACGAWCVCPPSSLPSHTH